jgi:hypothetical protein
MAVTVCLLHVNELHLPYPGAPARSCAGTAPGNPGVRGCWARLDGLMAASSAISLADQAPLGDRHGQLALRGQPLRNYPRLTAPGVIAGQSGGRQRMQLRGTRKLERTTLS